MYKCIKQIIAIGEKQNLTDFITDSRLTEFVISYHIGGAKRDYEAMAYKRTHQGTQLYSLSADLSFPSDKAFEQLIGMLINQHKLKSAKVEYYFYHKN